MVHSHSIKALPSSMAAFSFATTCHWPTFQQLHQDTAVFPPSPELLSFHDNFTFSDTCINNPLSLESNHHFSSFNNGVTTTNLSFHSPVRYPTLSSSYLPPITTQQHRLPKPLPDLTQLSSFTHGQYSPYPQNPNVWPMEHLQPELPPLPEIYHYGGSAVDPVMDTFQVKESDNGVHVTTGNRNVGGRLSAQSMAARVRRRRISEKTLELGKLVPGGHRMNTAEMFQAAFKYVKFLQAQVGVLQHIGSSQEQSEELHALVTSRSVQEKLYHAEKCIVTRTLGESLAVDHQGINDK